MDDKKCKEFIIDLDAPPADRWNEVAAEYGSDIKEAIKITVEGFPDIAVKIADFFGKELSELLPSFYREELDGLSQAIGVPVGEVFFYNLAYDITAHCTSVVTETSDGKILHARNLDMPRDAAFQRLVEISRKTVIAVSFRKQGVEVYSGVTTAGYLGLLTGQKPGAFTITLNERRTGSEWLNIIELLRDQPGSGVSLVIRDALSDPAMDFQGVVQKMTYIPLIAACYITIGGVNPGECVVITRDRKEAVQPLSNGVWKLDAASDQWYLLETNNDHWTQLPNIQPPDSNKDSYERKEAGDKAMMEFGKDKMSPDALFQVLSTKPVYNESTLYTAVMSAADSSVFSAWIRFPKQQPEPDPDRPRKNCTLV